MFGWDHTVHEKLFTLHRQKNQQHGPGLGVSIRSKIVNVIIIWIEDGESQKGQS